MSKSGDWHRSRALWHLHQRMDLNRDRFYWNEDPLDNSRDVLDGTIETAIETTTTTTTMMMISHWSESAHRFRDQTLHHSAHLTHNDLYSLLIHRHHTQHCRDPSPWLDMEARTTPIHYHISNKQPNSWLKLIPHPNPNCTILIPSPPFLPLV
jgi:hypothetical protein